MRPRDGSADSVVLPVPDRPKNSATSPPLAHVRRAVHREDALQRHQVVHHGEDRLLDLPRVRRVADDAEPLIEVQRDEGVRRRAVDLRDALERRAADHGEVGHVAPVLLVGLQRNEHVPREEAVPGVLGDDPHRHPVVRVGADVAVLHEQVAPLQEALQAREQLVELVGRERPVVLAPPDVRLGGRLAHDELVVGRPRGVLAGVHDDGAVAGDRAFPAEDDLLVQRLGRQVPVHPAQVEQAVVVQPVVALERRGLRLRGRLDVEQVDHSQSLMRRLSPM